MKPAFLVNTLMVILLLYRSVASSQAPVVINYQAVARDQNGTVLSGKDMRVRISLYDQNPSGSIVYSESKKVTTNKWGLFTLGIGNDEGLITRAGKLSDVDWSTNSKFIGIEIDPNGGNQFIQLGTSQLLSVPYSLYSLKSKDGVPSMLGQSHKILTNDGDRAFWDTLIIPKYQAGNGISIEGNALSIRDTPVFNAGKIANHPIDTNGKNDGDVIYWDSSISQYRHRSVNSLFGDSQTLTQGGNSFGTEMVIGTQDSFDINFKINNQVMAQLKGSREFNVDYFKPNKQFITPATFRPIDPVRLYNGEIAYNGEWIPGFAFEENPKTGITLENMEAPAMTLVNKGRPLLRTYWESGIVDNAAIIQGFGKNRLSIQSESNIVHIAKNGRYEWESTLGSPLDFVGYTAASSQGKTIRFTTEPIDPATPIAIMPYGTVNALEILEGEGNINSVFDHDGWLGINVIKPMAPMHIRNRGTSSNPTLAILENNLGEEVFTATNNRTSFFGGKAFYRKTPILNDADSNALVDKKYVDDRLATFKLLLSSDSMESHILVDPETTLSSYRLVFPLNPKNGMECYFYFGGKIDAGIVVGSLQLPEGIPNVLLSNPLPTNIQAGEVIGFRWFESSSKWYRRE